MVMVCAHGTHVCGVASSPVKHLILVVHGIGSGCDLARNDVMHCGECESQCAAIGSHEPAQQTT
jgi:hypothetical protein